MDNLVITILLAATFIAVAFLMVAATVGVRAILALLNVGRAQLEASKQLEQNEILPLSTGVLIETNQSAQITARPQLGAFTPHRMFISSAGTKNGAADWIVNDIKIGNESQLIQSGDIPGDMFAEQSLDSFIRMDRADRGIDVVIVVTYIGDNKKGCALYGAMIGHSDRRGKAAPQMLFESEVVVMPNRMREIASPKGASIPKVVQ